jgi:hypothetical protein
VSFVTEFRARESTQNLNFGSQFAPLGSNIAGANQGNLLCRRIACQASAVFLFVSSQYVILYRVFPIGWASPANIWWSVISVPLKSFVSSSWKTWAYSNSTGSIGVFPVLMSGVVSRVTIYSIGLHSSPFSVGGSTGLIRMSSINYSLISSASPNTVAVGMIISSSLEFAVIT